MMRLISVLFLLLGLGVALYGGWRLLPEDQQNAVLRAASSVPGVSKTAPMADQGGEDEPNEEELAAIIEEINNIETAAGGNVDAPEPASRRLSVPGLPLPESSSAADGAANAPEPNFGTASMPTRTEDTFPAEEPVDAPSFAERLYQVPVAYETPEMAAYKAPFNVTFAVDGTGDDSAVDALPGRDTNVVEGSAKISDRIKASLIGSAFEIELLSPDIQRVSLLTENVWRWRVTPIEEGQHALIVELFALENDEAVPLRTFSEEVVVSVSSIQRVISAANSANPIFVVLGGLGSAIGGFFGIFRFFRKGH